MDVRRFYLLIAIALVGCGSSQAPEGFPGDPVVQYGGYVSGMDPVPPFEVKFTWQAALPPVMAAIRLPDGGVATTKYNIQGMYTVFWFQALLFQPPPADVFVGLRDGEPRFARGNVITVPMGIGAAGIESLPGSENPAYGADLCYWLLFFESDVQPGSLTAWWLHDNPLPAGYHRVRVDEPHCLTAEEFDACAAELVPRGLTDDGTYGPGTARAFCAAFAPFRVTPAESWEAGNVTLGTYDFPDQACVLP